MNENTIINLQSCEIYQGDAKVLRNVNFQVVKGEFVYLIGKTGSGKSSLLKTLYGDLPLIEGSGHVAGHDLRRINWKNLPTLRRDLGIVFQDFRLLSDRNVYANLEFVLRATGWKDKGLIQEKINSVLSKVGLQDKAQKMTYQMSGGEQQRVDIARALLNNPKLILADEPTGNLDPDTRDEIMTLMRNICRDFESAIVMATHDYSIIQKYPARVIRVEDGELQEVEPVYA